ncbi:enoyl-ACP reductase FabV [Treponema sp.]|uniref:enoyl-ACP reductase FabV n=1 Tax=Treponema sp. TaxID=166 RepID=UPI00298ECBCE|nr:enoyl-ACP reductase FabV [Treponema sp.]
MIVEPKIRSNICINAHPAGCAKDTVRQIEYVKAQKAKRGIKTYKEGGKGPKTVLVLGCSTGYGLASRIAASFEYGADTIGVSFEKEGTETRGGTPGFYNNMAFDREAKAAGLKSVTINGDAYSNEVREQVIAEIKKLGKKIDLLVYSLASPVRTDPETKVMYKSVIKPIGKPYSGKCLDIIQEKLTEASAEPATEEEMANTVKVMGGEDWKLWIDALTKADCLAEGICTVAYSYIGPELSHAIYRDGTIGGAKKHLEKTARELDAQLKSSLGGRAYVSENKGLVTRSSAVIPVISLYLAVLFKVMKEMNLHEGCIEQMERLFAERLYLGPDSQMTDVPVDSENRIRLDDWELREDVQSKAVANMNATTDDNLAQYCDLAGYKHDFLAANGFDVEGIDYSKDVERFDVI